MFYTHRKATCDSRLCCSLDGAGAGNSSSHSSSSSLRSVKSPACISSCVFAGIVPALVVTVSDKIHGSLTRSQVKSPDKRSILKERQTDEDDRQEAAASKMALRT